MRSESVATMGSVRGEVVVLEEVGIDAAIDDLMTVVTVRQRYRNPGDTHLEAVYTFPLPLDAVLLDFAVQLGERTLAGTVIAKSAAERRYEDAITDGDAAVLLEQPQPGLYTANVGNLAPGETATVTFRYGLLLRWNGDRVRLRMPTTIAPRYGDPAAGGLAPHQAPDFTFDAERCFSLTVAVRGALQNARWDSPTHDIAVTPEARHTKIEIARAAAMDRDFVLEARSAQPTAARALLAPDGDGWVVLASVRPRIPDLEGGPRRSVTLVVDCSGSMSGDSIAQVRVAGERILDSLRAGDRFEIVAFGDRHRTLFGRPTPVTEQTVARARRFVRRLDADLGGTEIGAALNAAYRLPDDADMRRDLLLITDGEVWDTERVIAQARACGHRIFTVGVGSSVAEPFVRALADATGGACELVVPREDMAERIHRHFQRIVASPSGWARVNWPAPVQQATPDPLPPLYDGDTVHVFGWFAARPQGSVSLDLELADGRVLRHQMEIDSLPAEAARADVARLGASQRLLDIEDAAAATALAVRYQLLSQWTSYLVVHVRAAADKATDLPTLIKVPQVLAAGWHGLGTVQEAAAPMTAAYGMIVEPPPGAPRLIREYDEAPPLPLRTNLRARKRPASISPAAELVAALNAWPLPSLPTLDDLQERGVPGEVVLQLQALVDDGADPDAVVSILLYLLCESAAGSGVDRQQRRRIVRAYQALAPDAEAVAAVQSVWILWDRSSRPDLVEY